MGTSDESEIVLWIRSGSLQKAVLTENETDAPEQNRWNQRYYKHGEDLIKSRGPTNMSLLTDQL